MFIIYDIIFGLFALIYLPYSWLRGKKDRRFGKRLGNFDAAVIKELKASQNIWVHAVSVGEVLAVIPFIDALKMKFPGHRLVLSTVTPTGFELAREKLKGRVTVIPAPLDLSWIVRKYVKTIQPKIYIATETEIWPNLYTALHAAKVPIALINGRISERSFPKYKLVKFLLRGIFDCVDLFLMQSQTDADRIIALGADEERVRLVGNIKFDQMFFDENAAVKYDGFGRQDFFLAGSTHPGEEKIVLDLHKKLSAEFPAIRLIIAPRHIERVDEVLKIIEAQRFRPLKFSQLKNEDIGAQDVVLVDTIGDLRSLYGCARIVFIGKTLMVGGGQNMIEPAAFGRPVVVGPLTQNFQDVMQTLLNERAIVQVRSADELYPAVAGLLKNQTEAGAMGERARNIVLQAQGATKRTIQLVEGLLNR